jgi:hypothetical protein
MISIFSQTQRLPLTCLRGSWISKPSVVINPNRLSSLSALNLPMGLHGPNRFDTFKPMMIQMSIVPAMPFCDRIVCLCSFIGKCFTIGHGLVNTTYFDITCFVAFLGGVHLAAMDSFESTWGGQVVSHRCPIKVEKRGFSRITREDAFLQLQFYLGCIPIPVIVRPIILECH